MNVAKKLLLSSFLCLPWKMLFAAACCGSMGNTSGLIATDDRLQLGVQFSAHEIMGESTTASEYVARSASDTELRRQLRVDAGFLLSDQWQLAVGVPFFWRERALNGMQASSVKLGDLSVVTAYEFLPEWTFSVWRPRGYVFASVTAPTGLSMLESQAPFAIDATGKGSWALGAGTLLTKTWGTWDANFLGEIRKPLNATLSTSSGSVLLQPQVGWAATLGSGWSPKWVANGRLRLGGGIQYTRDGASQVVGAMDIENPASHVWTVSLQASWLVRPGLTVGMTVSDQTLLKAASNSALTSGVALVVQNRWER